MFTVWHGLFPLILMFPGLRIEALPLSKVLRKSIYTIFKRRTRKLSFHSYVPVCTKPSIDKHKFLSFKVGSPEAVLSAIHAT